MIAFQQTRKIAAQQHLGQRTSRTVCSRPAFLPLHTTGHVFQHLTAKKPTIQGECHMTADDRIHSILHGQTAPRAGHGVRILWRCPSCERPWLQDPRLPHSCRVRLSTAEAQRVAQELHATLDDLPRATCRLCCYAAGGELSIDQYGAGDGFGLSWLGGIKVQG
jgi:hypothetical protein